MKNRLNNNTKIYNLLCKTALSAQQIGQLLGVKCVPTRIMEWNRVNPLHQIKRIGNNYFVETHSVPFKSNKEIKYEQAYPSQHIYYADGTYYRRYDLVRDGRVK